MNRLILLFFTLAFALALPAQEADDALFPASWAGTWAGRLEIFNPEGKVQDIPMELQIRDVDTAFTWTITYGAGDQADRRDYLLRPVKAQMGLFQIDEQNSIVLDATYIAGKLFSRFDVMGNLLLSTTEVVDGEMRYEIISGKAEARHITGGQEYEGEQIPEVKSMPVVIRQYALLRRK
ncbi:MAG: hypothetical protein KDC66_05580 [Phaeodactylibacter sp.]|nr:hypothetical protein [Phaeodactylibacter sp.]MCB9275717.1 hypothetical protein [Lewinellaceae bacterium]